MFEILGPKELKGMMGKKVKLVGWVHDVRVLGGIVFILLRNSKGINQITVKKSSDVFDLATKLHQEDVIFCEGLVTDSKQAKDGFEIIPEMINVLSKSSTPLPLDPRGITNALIDTRLEWRPIDLRTEKMHAVFQITNFAVRAMEEFLQGMGFIRVFTPSIIGGISEGGAEVFKIDFYGKPAFLRQDPQLHRQLTIAGGFERIYDLGTNWRAELSHTPRHLSEHRTIAPEIAFINDESDIMDIQQRMVAHTISMLIEKYSDLLSIFNLKLKEPVVPFPELRFPEIYSILESLGKRLPKGEDIDTEAQRLLAKYVYDKYNSDFFFVNWFPFKTKPFYVMKVDDDPEYARSVDLVYKGVELSSGGQREHRYEKIISQIEEKNMNTESLRWFTEHFRYGVPPHGGYSFGIERFIAALLGLENIKEASLFPRDPERLLP